MFRKKHIWFVILAAVLGFLWGYSFSTRINLLFIVPLWLKIIVLGGLTLNFGLLAHHLMIEFVRRISEPKWMIYFLTGSVFLSALLFVILPYQRVPFRTTHQLRITALDSDVKLKAVLSPDDNLVSRDQFSSEGQVESFAETGFRLSSGGTLSYQRAQTGGLTLSFTLDSAPIKIQWDNQEQALTPSQVHPSAQQEIQKWRFSSDPVTNTFNVRLPGNTWGQPDTFWAILGILLPISDFISLTSLIIFSTWFVLRTLKKQKITFPKSGIIKYWTDSLLVIGLAMLLIKVGFPYFIPFWFLLFFLPAVLYLACHQASQLTLASEIHLHFLSRLRDALQKFGKFLFAFSHNRWTFWIGLTLIVIIGAAVQLHLTQPGMGISGDSVHYLQGAKNLAYGNGYVLHITEGEPIPITGFEPAYPTLLAAGIRLGGAPEDAARILNLVLFCISIALTGWLIFQITGAAIPALLGSAFLVMAPNIMSIFAWVMSEPLFIALLLAILLIMYGYYKKPTHWKAFLAGALSGLMMYTRLAGAVFLPPFVLTMLILKNQRLGERIRNVLIFGFTAMLAPAAFLVRNHFLTPSSSPSRGEGWASFSTEYWEIIGSEVSSWFKWHTFFNLEHQRFNAIFASLGFILVLFIAWLIFQKQLPTHKHARVIMILLLVSIPIYILAIILNTIILTPEQTVSGLSRYMIPVFIITLILIFTLMSIYWKRPQLLPKIIILFLCLVSLQIYFEEFTAILEEQPGLYRQYTDRNNDCGDEIRVIVTSHPERGFYTNNCEYFFYTTGELCRYLPSDGSLYQPDSIVSKALESGDWVAFTEDFGTNPPGAKYFLRSLEQFDSACYFDFYRSAKD